MVCPGCGAPVDEGAGFCERCGWKVERTRQPVASGATYGAVTEAPNWGARIGAVLGVLLLVGAIAGVIFYQTSDQRRRDQADMQAFSTQLDAVSSVVGPLERLDEAAVATTKPADYAKLVAETKAAVDGYHSASKL